LTINGTPLCIYPRVAMQDAEEAHALAELVKNGIRIPSQPKILLELDRILARRTFDPYLVATIIAKDPGLVAMLFKTARSPVFAAGRKFGSLEQVLTVLGAKQVNSLVRAAALPLSINNQKRMALDVFWLRSGEVAHLAAMIAEDQMAACNVFPEHAYMAGIFNKCGVPVLMMRYPKYCELLNLDDANDWPSLADEDERFGVDHCTVGYLVARHWGLPDYVCRAILRSNDPPDEGLGAMITLMCILQLASHFYHRINGQPNALWDTIGSKVLEEIGIPASDEDDYFEQVSRRFLASATTDAVPSMKRVQLGF